MNETIISLIFQMAGAALLPLVIGWAVALSQKRKENAGRLPKRPLITGALIGLVFAGTSLFQTLSENARHAIIAKRVDVPSPGKTDADLTTDALQVIGKRTQSILNNDASGQPRTTFSTAVIQQGGKRFGIIKYRTGGVTPMITFFGLSNGILTEVFCSQGDSLGNLTNVDIRSPQCTKELQSAFGTIPAD